MQYTPQGNRLVPFPIVEKPNIGVFVKVIEWDAYNQWLSLPQPLILPEYEKDFKSKPVFEEGIDFEIRKKVGNPVECINNPGAQIKWIDVAIPTFKPEEKYCDAAGHYGGEPLPEGICPKCGKQWNLSSITNQ